MELTGGAMTDQAAKREALSQRHIEEWVVLKKRQDAEWEAHVRGLREAHMDERGALNKRHDDERQALREQPRG